MQIQPRFWLQAALAVLSKVTWATVNRLSQSHCNLLTRALEGLFLTSRTWASTCSLRCGSQPHHRRGRTGPEHARNFSCALASAAPVTSDMSTHALIGHLFASTSAFNVSCVGAEFSFETTWSLRQAVTAENKRIFSPEKEEQTAGTECA